MLHQEHSIIKIYRYHGELYAGLEYTYRDILDEIAQATGGIIVINNNDEIEVKYPNATSDTIDEEFLKDVNVDFGEKYGPINSIVLSRAGESDNVYLQDAESVAQNGLCEVKIVDNQIMNGNNRSDYLQGILSALDGLYYYKNDFSSTGICYYDIYDLYNVQIGENTYQCLMLNDEIDIKNGIEEYVHTDLPEQSETDYSKADKTDRRLNQTYLIVDKQNQTIEGMVSNISEQNEQIASIRLQYNELLSRISDVADITTSGESSYASVPLADVNTSQPILIKIHPITENIDYLYPYNTLYPSSTLYPRSPILRFTNTTTSEVFEWVLPTSLWYYDSTTYDELELSYGDGTNSTVTVTRRCKINADAIISALSTPTTETYAYPTWLILSDGDYQVSLANNTVGYLYVQLMAKNIYTTQFYTKAETNSIIDQTASEITLGVNQTLSNYSTTNQMNSAINLKAGEITSSVSQTYETKDNAQTNYSQITQTTDGLTTAVGQKVGNNEVISKINQSSEAVTINANKISLSASDVINLLAGNTINLSSKNIVIASNNFNVDASGNMTCSNANVRGKVTVGGNEENPEFIATDGNNRTYIFPLGLLQEYSMFNEYASVQKGGFGVGTYTSSGMNETGKFTAEVIQHINTYNRTSSSSANVRIDNSGYFYRATGSSKRWKTDITDKIEERLDPKQLYDLPIKQFKYKEGYLDKKDKRYNKNILGFIAEDVQQIYEPATEYDENGQVEMWNSDVIIPAMLKLIQEQHKEIEDLHKEIKEMKGDKNDKD